MIGEKAWAKRQREAHSHGRAAMASSVRAQGHFHTEDSPKPSKPLSIRKGHSAEGSSSDSIFPGPRLIVSGSHLIPDPANSRTGF